jgi:hypothetical protein
VANWRAARPTELQRLHARAGGSREQIGVLFTANNNDHYLCASRLERNMKIAVPPPLRRRRLSDRANGPAGCLRQFAERSASQAWTRAGLVCAWNIYLNAHFCQCFA